jgi:hypothetical protein
MTKKVIIFQTFVFSHLQRRFIVIRFYLDSFPADVTGNRIDIRSGGLAAKHMFERAPGENPLYLIENLNRGKPIVAKAESIKHVLLDCPASLQTLLDLMILIGSADAVSKLKRMMSGDAAYPTQLFAEWQKRHPIPSGGDITRWVMSARDKLASMEWNEEDRVLPPAFFGFEQK